MKILQICNFSSGISGVFTRVLEDSKQFIKKGYEVYIFSSNETENGVKMDPLLEEVISPEGIKVKRFPIKRRQGYALWFNFKKEALELKPDIIICHGLRKPYLGPALKIARKINARIFLVTHAPFVDKELRSKKLNFIIRLYDKFYGKKVINSFDKIISICKWEEPFLLKLGCDKDKLEYIPNSISYEFFKTENKEREGIYYLGRISQLKDLETLDLALANLNMIATAIGPLEEDYNPKFKSIKIKSPIYDLNEKIEEVNKYEIFVLPSKREGFPFVLLEAMAMGKLVISSRTKGAEELVKDCKNGFLFEIGNSKELESILKSIMEMSKEGKDKIKEEAIKTAEQFKSSNIVDKWEELFK